MKGRNEYINRMTYLSEHEKLTSILDRINKAITGLVFVIYPLLLFYLLIKKDNHLLRAVLVPLVSFVLVSAFRHIVNRKRPYEVYETKAAIAKDSKGKSFPSRHVFSAYIIGMTYLWAVANPMAGIIILVAGIFLAWVRYYSGVHFLVDVICGAIVGIAFGIIGFYII